MDVIQLLYTSFVCCNRKKLSILLDQLEFSNYVKDNSSFTDEAGLALRSAAHTCQNRAEIGVSQSKLRYSLYGQYSTLYSPSVLLKPRLLIHSHTDVLKWEWAYSHILSILSYSMHHM